jgi:hypothetical protein
MSRPEAAPWEALIDRLVGAVAAPDEPPTDPPQP